MLGFLFIYFIFQILIFPPVLLLLLFLVVVVFMCMYICVSCCLWMYLCVFFSLILLWNSCVCFSVYIYLFRFFLKSFLLLFAFFVLLLYMCFGFNILYYISLHYGHFDDCVFSMIDRKGMDWGGRECGRWTERKRRKGKYNKDIICEESYFQFKKNTNLLKKKT